MDRLIEYLKKQIQLFQGHRAEEHNAVKSAGEDMQIAESIKPRAEPPSPRASAGMVKVPKGPFLYGEDKHREAIDYDYWIGIYPVTNKEFGAFISAHGYQNQAYWSQEGWKWRTDNNIQSPDRDYWKDAKWDKFDHPVVGVSYYEAEAYAKWVGMRLPTEQEWEKAARGTDGRMYPWGNEFDKNKCNCNEASIGHTTPITRYPDGISPYGCYDMAGNVWEWCASWLDEEKVLRVMRGGSWSSTPEILLAAPGFMGIPNFRFCNIGFRLVQDSNE